MTQLACDYSFARPDPQAIVNAGYIGVMRYLSGDPNSGKDLTLPEVATLFAAGLNIGLVWETTGTDYQGGEAQGQADAVAANNEAGQLGVPLDVPIFFAIDTNANPQSVLPYLQGAQNASARPVRVYGSVGVVDAAFQAGFGQGWQTEAWSGTTVSANAVLYQRTTPTLTIAGASPGSWDEDVVLGPMVWWTPSGSQPTPAPDTPVTPAQQQPNGAMWLVAKDGGVFALGGAPFLGNTYTMGYTGLGGANPLPAPIVGLLPTSSGQGYWLVDADGGVFSFGDAQFYGSIPGLPANERPPVGVKAVSLLPAPDDQGYWEVTSAGDVYSFGNAQFYGSAGDIDLAAPITSAAITPSGQGYWLVGADGGVFSFGDAQFFGSLPGLPAGQRPPAGVQVVGLVPTADGRGYWEVTSAGDVYSFGDAPFFGSTGDQDLAAPIVGMLATSSGQGYWLVGADGSLYPFGDAVNEPGLVQQGVVPVAPIVGAAS